MFQFSLSLNNIWLRYNKKAKGVFFLKHGVEHNLRSTEPGDCMAGTV